MSQTCSHHQKALPSVTSSEVPTLFHILAAGYSIVCVISAVLTEMQLYCSGLWPIDTFKTPELQCKPELISQLMVLDISPFGVSSSISSLPRFVEMMRRLSLPPSLSLQEARTTVDRTLQSVVPEKEIRQFLLTNLYKDDSGDFKWKANLESISKNFNPHISAFPLSQCGERYDGPTSFIGGALSDYIKPHEHRDIKKVFPHATFQYLEGAGHWLHADKPKDFLQMVTPLVF